MGDDDGVGIGLGLGLGERFDSVKTLSLIGISWFGALGGSVSGCPGDVTATANTGHLILHIRLTMHHAIAAHVKDKS